jgi:oligopeptide transport system substrate-binding protein
MPGHDPSLGKQYNFDATKARQLLSEAGYPDGQGLSKPVLLMRTSDTNQIVAQYVQDQFKKVLGVDVDIEMADAATYSARFSRGQYNFTVGSWTAAWPYPDNWLSNLFLSGSTGNLFGYSNPKTDELLQRASAELDRAKQLELYGQAQKTILDDAGIVPIYHAEIFLVLSPRVHDFVATGIDGNIKGDMNLWRTWIARSSS